MSHAPRDEIAGSLEEVQSDRTWLPRTAGQEGALATFVAAHYPRLVGLAGMVCGDAQSAEDIVQTALERAWRSRRALRDDASLRPWLDRIVVREAAREQRWRLAWIGRLVRPPSVREISDPALQLIDRIATGFPERAALRLAFDGLGPAHRAVVVLHLHVGYTVEETADLLGIPFETVRSRLRVARERLRVSLEGGDR